MLCGILVPINLEKRLLTTLTLKYLLSLFKLNNQLNSSFFFSSIITYYSMTVPIFTFFILFPDAQLFFNNILIHFIQYWKIKVYNSCYNKMAQNSTNSIQTQPQIHFANSGIQRRAMILTLRLIRNLQMSDLIYIFLLFIDFLQIVSIVIGGNFFAKWEGGLFFYIRESLGYLNMQTLIKNNNQTHQAILAVLIAIIVVNYIVLALMLKYGPDSEGSTQLDKIVISIVGFFLILLKSFLQIPIFFMIIYGFIQQEASGLTIGLSISLTVLLIPILLYDIFIFQDLNPFSTIVFKGETHYQKIINLIVKISLVLYCIFDKKKSNELAMLIILMCVKIIGIIYNHLFKDGQQFNERIRYYKQWQRYVLVWLILFILFADLSSRNSLLFVYFIIISIACFAQISYVEKRLMNKILYQNFTILENESKIQAHVLALITLIDTIEKRSSRILLEGYIAFHTRNCNLPGSTCICRKLEHVNIQLQSLKYFYFDFVANLLKGSLIRVKNQRRIYLLLSFVYQCRLNNKFQAVHFLLRTQFEGVSIVERQQFLKQMKSIEYQITEADEKKNINVAIDKMKFLTFNMKIVQFEELLNKCTNDHIDFWNQITEENLNIRKLQKCGAIVAKQKETVKNFFHQLQELNSNNAHVMMLYGQFLFWVCNEDFQTTKLIEKGETILKNIKQSSRINGKNQKYSQNSSIPIIIISGNEKQLGRIVQTNNFVNQCIGYKRKQLISQNISMLMPKVFAQFHDATLQRFLTTSKDKSNGTERLVPVLGKDGYIIPCLAFTKSIPNLEFGVQMVGFLSEYNQVFEDEFNDQKIAYILYDCQNQLVMGISKTCYTQFGIPKSLVYGDPQNFSNQLKMKNLFGICLQKNESYFQNGKQLVANLNTKDLSKEFIIANTMSTKKIIQLGENVNKGVSFQVIIRSILKINYHDQFLRIISISKDNDGRDQADDNKKSMNQQNYKPIKEQKSDSKSETDELKDLKDFKNFISVKRQPKSLEFINLACIFLLFVFLVGVIGFLIIHLSQISMINMTSQGIRLAFLNRMYLNELSFETEKIFINNNQIYPVRQSFDQSATRASIRNIIQLCKQSQMQLLPIKNVLGVQELLVNDFNFYPDGGYKNEQKSIDQIVTIQLNKLFNIATTSGDYLSQFPLNYKSLTVTNYQQTKYTQVFSLIFPSNNVQQYITKSASQQNYQLNVFIIIQCSILIFFVVIWIIVSLPRTLQVMDINSKVLSLFNLISIDDVRGLMKRCYIFQAKYLVEADIDEKKLSEVSQMLKQTDTNNNQKRRNGEVSDFKQTKSGIPNNSFLDTSARFMVSPQEKKFHSDNFDNSDNENKMIKKDNGDKKKAILTYTIIFLLLVIYTLTLSLYLILNYNLVQTETKALNSIYNRTAQFEEIKTGYIKYLMDRSLTYNGISIGSINLNLISKIYEMERMLTQGQFSQFASIMTQLNTDNICASIDRFSTYMLWGENNLNMSECQNIYNGILTRGIKTSLVTIMEEIRTMLSLAESDWQKMNILNLLTETINKYAILQKYIVRPLLMICSELASIKQKHILKINLIFYLLNGLFLFFTIIFWRLGWRRYLQYLNQSVWRTKSMLNVIPSKIITNNETLMKQFTSGQLQKIVK